MSIPAAIESRRANASERSAGRIAAIDIVEDLSQIEQVWRALEHRHHLSTPYQRFDLLNAWQHQVGSNEKWQPYIVVAYDRDRRPLLLLPLALICQQGLRTARFMGGKHSNFNMGLWDRNFAAEATRGDLSALLSGLRKRGDLDLLALRQQPMRWRDLLNPMALLPNQASANDCPLLIMPPGATSAALIGNSFRRRLNGKERKLQKLSGYRYHIAVTDTEINRLLDWFFATKPRRMAEQRLPNVFAEPGVEQFIRDACRATLPGGGRVIDIHALDCDEEVIALFAGVADGYRFSMMFNTYTMSGHSRYSPGLILARRIVDHCAESGYREVDLGIGADDYKRFFCKSNEPIFDSFIPLSIRGQFAAAAMSAATRAKYMVKHNQTLLGTARHLQRALR
jgi:CelD/BcsL family acetyltransferase involved in cellulose biosynthesis